MLILFFKSIGASSPRRTRRRTIGDEALKKIRAILQERVDEAETDEDQERAEREIQKIE